MMKAMALVALAALPLTAAVAQTAPGGGSIFDKAVNQPGIGWSLYGPDLTAKQVAAADVPGGAAAHVEVKRAGAHPWDSGATYPTIKPVAAGDTLLAMVYLRAPNAKEGAGAALQIGATGSDAPYIAISGETVQVGPTWKRYFATGVSPQAFAPGKARIAVQLAGAKQVVELGPAFLLDLGKGVDPAKLPHN